MQETLTQQLLILAIIMFFGFVATKKGIITEQTSSDLSNVLLYIANPALIIASYNMEFNSETLKKLGFVLVSATVVAVVSIIVSIILTSKFREDRRRILRFGLVFSNSGYMGLPLIAIVFGSEGLMYASIYTIAYNTATWTYGDAQMSGVKMSNPVAIAKKLATNPSLIAVFVGLAIFLLQIKLPYVVTQPFELLGKLTGPLSMLILGEKVSKIDFVKACKDIGLCYGIILRLFVMPVVTLITLRFMNVPDDITQVIFVLNALPSAIMTVVLSNKYKLNVEYASQLTIITHILCVITVPFVSSLLYLF